MNEALVFVGHGSPHPSAAMEFMRLVEYARERNPAYTIEYCCLNHQSPSIEEMVEICAKRGVETIVMLPVFLFRAGHVKKDIPTAIQTAQRRFPHLSILLANSMAIHPKLLEVCTNRIVEVEQTAAPLAREETLLLTAASGSVDPCANGDVCKLTRMIGEEMGFGWAASCFLALTRPNLQEGLQRCQRMGYKRIIVVPLLLFAGVMMDRIQKILKSFAMDHSETEFLLANHLNEPSLLIEILEDRAYETIHRGRIVNGMKAQDQ